MPFGYRKLLSEKNFLKVQVRARQLMRGGSDLVAILYKDRELIFKTKSGTTRGVIWTQRVIIDDLTIENILAATKFKDIEDLVKNSGLHLSCNCPAFLYWGFKYLAWKKGYGIEKETRRPIVRNPQELGYVCKHLYLVLQLYPFWSKALASKFRNYAVRNEEALSQNKDLQRVRMTQTNREFAENQPPLKSGEQQLLQEIENEVSTSQ